MSLTRDRRRGNAMIEFTLVGIPLIFVLISVFEMARGMWLYHTLAYAVKEGTRYAIVHGQNCGVSPNACTITVGDVARRVRDAGIGLMPNELTIDLYVGAPPSPSNPKTPDVSCDPIDNCLTNGNQWPAYPNNQVGSQISILGRYPFRSALSMFWPGKNAGVSFGVFNFPASSTEQIQF